MKQSEIVGELNQERFDDGELMDWWKGKDISVPFFNNILLPVIFVIHENDEQILTEGDKALLNFLKLSESEKFSFSKLAYDEYYDFRVMAGLEIKINESNMNEIWKLVYPTCIYIRRHYEGEEYVKIRVACECKWDRENGLYLEFKEGKTLSSVSGQY